MDLYNDAMESCMMIHKLTENDAYGSEVTRFVRGARFYAAITFDTSIQARVGLSQGVKNMYTIYTRKEKVLDPFDLFERESDGKTFRVTSDSRDKKTPSSSMIDMRVCTAEEWAIPGEVRTL